MGKILAGCALCLLLFGANATTGEFAKPGLPPAKPIPQTKEQILNKRIDSLAGMIKHINWWLQPGSAADRIISEAKVKFEAGIGTKAAWEEAIKRKDRIEKQDLPKLQLEYDYLTGKISRGLYEKQIKESEEKIAALKAEMNKKETSLAEYKALSDKPDATQASKDDTAKIAASIEELKVKIAAAQKQIDECNAKIKELEKFQKKIDSNSDF